MSNEVTEDQRKSKHGCRWLVPGCFGFIFMVCLAVYAMVEWLSYGFQSPSFRSVPGAPEGFAIWFYDGGLDSHNPCFAIASLVDDKIYTMSSSFMDARAVALVLSKDGQLAVTELDRSSCRQYRSSNSATVSSESLTTLTHAYNFSTGEYIGVERPCGEDPELREARHESIEAMLAEHGGEGMRHTYKWSLGEVRRMTYWEWRRWRGPLRAAHDRLSR